MKKFGERGERAYPGTSQFFGYPLLSQEREKLRISNLASRFRGSTHVNLVVNISPLEILEKRSVAYPETAQFFGTPYYLRNRKSYGFQI